MNTCSQCGRPFSDPACGPTHALVYFEKSKLGRMPVILWVGDSPTVPTGFAACTRAVCDHLHLQGWQVHVLGINEFGDPHPDVPYPIYPCWHPYEGGRDLLGATRLPYLIESIKPDVVVILSDPWQIPGYLDHINYHFKANAYTSHRWTSSKTNSLNDPDEWARYCADCGVEGLSLDCGGDLPLDFPHCRQNTPIVAWLAVDGLNQVTAPRLNDLTRVVVWTEFAANELVKRGLNRVVSGENGECILSPCAVPLGVDTSIFRPATQSRAREILFANLNLPIDPPPFIVGYVGRNQPRKRLDLLLAYFAEWIATRNLTDAYLFLHVAPTKDMGADLQALAHYYGLDAVTGNGRLIVSEQPTHKGTDVFDMPLVYSAMDVFLATTQGEGHGLCEHEAMACGTIVIAPDWSGLGSDGGWPTPGSIIHVPCTATALTAPINSQCHTIGGIPDRIATLQALDQVYNDWKVGEGPTALVKLTGLKCAREFTWERSAREMEKVLREVFEK